MIAVDTNVVVRIIVNDDPRQTSRAEKLVEVNQVLLLTTVLLESEWVLRSMYGLSRERVHATLLGFCALPNVHIEETGRVEKALNLYRDGFDFADALHLNALEAPQSFATFDRSLRKRAAKRGVPLGIFEP